MTMNISEKAVRAAKGLRASEPKARARILDAREIEHAIRVHLRVARRVAKRDPTREVITTLRGGFVANSYKYGARSDMVTLRGHTARDLRITTGRGRAQCRQQGVGDTLLVRSKTPEQVQGRIEHAE